MRPGTVIDEHVSGIRSPGERARIVLVFFSDQQATRAADVTNEIAHRLTLAGMRLRSEQARVTTEFLRRELESAEVALREQSKKVSEFEQQHRGELPSELESNLRRLERLQQQRNSLALQIADLAAQVLAGEPLGVLPDPRSATAGR